jgi:hypothetical protein
VAENGDIRIVLALAEAAGRLASFCDRLEHGESSNRTVVEEVGALLRATAFSYAQGNRLDLVDLYARRLGRSERNHVLGSGGDFDGEQAVRVARTLRDLQVAQIGHDRAFRPDVYGLPRYEQLRHCALHLAKLAGSAAEAYKDHSLLPDFHERRLPDALLFGLKLATLADQRLAKEPLEELTAGQALLGVRK